MNYEQKHLWFHDEHDHLTNVVCCGLHGLKSNAKHLRHFQALKIKPLWAKACCRGGCKLSRRKGAQCHQEEENVALHNCQSTIVSQLCVSG